MQIDRSNYEIWVIDWLDGNLSKPQVEQLEVFLSENADLNEEIDELKVFILNPSSKSFPQKEQLKRSATDISTAQFEYLCIACLENDLTPDQRIEMTEIVGKNPEKQKSFELFQKIKLAPGPFIYKHRKKLLKITPLQKVIRLSLIGLAVAATVFLIFLINIIAPVNRQDKLISTAHNIVVDSSMSEPSVSNVKVKTLPEEKPVTKKKTKENQIAVVQKSGSFLNQADRIVSINVDSLTRNPGSAGIPVAKVPVYADIVLKEKNIANTLVASNYNYTIPVDDEEGNKLGRFIARTFREKILKENSSAETPLKAYEIAEAGVTGLNRLLGWEMALDEKKDENGELRSVYFSSKILKFNAPVKKTDPLP